MSSLTEAFDVPIHYKADGLDVQFPKLDIDDHAAWCEEIHAERKPRVLKLIPGNAGPIDRFKMQRNAEFEEPTLDDIANLIWTPKGAGICLRKSLAKTGKSTDEASAIIKKIKSSEVQSLAMKASGLFTSKPPEIPILEKRVGTLEAWARSLPSPLGLPGSESVPTSIPVTGDGQDSSSPSTFANPLGG